MCDVDAALALRTARRDAGLSQRELARQAGTSQSTLSAYEAGTKQPSAATLARLLETCGARLAVQPAGGRGRLERAGRHLAEAIALAEALPYRPRRELTFPRLPGA